MGAVTASSVHRATGAILIALLLSLPVPRANPQDVAGPGYAPQFGGIPGFFEQNLGQAEARVAFLGRHGRTRVYFTTTGVIFSVAGEDPVRMRFPGANPSPRLSGEAPLSSSSNYLVGADPAAWRTRVPHYERVRYHGLYAGIDVVFYRREGHLEYDFIIAPGADPDQIQVAFAEIGGISLNGRDEVVMAVDRGGIVQTIPAVYQDIAGVRVAVGAKQVVDPAGRIRFALAGYDRGHVLVLDPALQFSRYFGGSGEEEIINLTADATGNIYVTGGTSSPDLPAAGDSLPYPEDMFDVEGNRLAFVAKLDPSGTRLLYMTYLGGRRTSTSHYIRVDQAGNAYVTGRTEASDFPTVNPIQAGYAGGTDDIFVSKLNRDGTALIYSTYLGGSEYDQARSLALDGNGNVYLTGRTDSADFPVVDPVIADYAGEQDGFVTKLNRDGDRIVYSTYLGGRGNDIGHAITVDEGGYAYVTGLSNSPDFPTAGAYQPAWRGGEGDDAIVVKVKADGTGFVYSTFIGGSGDDESRAITVDAVGSAIISGYTRSRDFPTRDALQDDFGGGSHDIFVTALTAKGSDLAWSTYLGGSGSDYGRGLAIDPAGHIYLTGYTSSANDFPLQQPLQEEFAGGEADAFVMMLAPAAARLMFSSFLGGGAHERGRAVTVDAAGNILVSGHTESEDFPVSSPASPGFGGGADDAFLIKLTPE